MQPTDTKTRIEEALRKLPPKERARVIAASKAHLQLVAEARKAGLPMSTPEEIRESVQKLAQAARAAN
jgi:hypothetical protein